VRCSISTVFLARVVSVGDVFAMFVKASRKKAEATASMSIVNLFGCFWVEAAHGGCGLLGCQIASLDANLKKKE